MDIMLVESNAFTGGGFKLDKVKGIAYGVAVCGRESLNGRDYPDAVRDRDKAVYAEAQVFIDHADRERRVREWFGALKNPRTRVGDRKTVADLHYPKNSQFTAEFEERAERFPGSFGFSHVAVCSTKRVGGREVIEQIRAVHSVDLVAKAATNAGLYESAGRRVVPGPITWSESATPAGGLSWRDEVPTDGAAFARWLEGKPSPEKVREWVDHVTERDLRPDPDEVRRFVESIRS